MSRRKKSATVQSTTTRSFRGGERELVQVVGARHPPAEEAVEAQAEHLGDPLVPAERRDLAEHLVAVRLWRAGQVLRQAPGLAERVLARGRVGPVALRVGDERAVAERPDMLVPAHAKHLVDLDAALLVERQRPLAQEGVRRDPGRPDERARRDPRSVAEDGVVGGDRLERRLDVDLHPALAELGRGVVAERRRDLGQDPRRRVDEHPAARRRAQARVVAERVLGEVGQLRERLDTRVAGADEDEGQPPRPLLVVERSVGQLELLEDVVAQIDRIGQRLEREPVLGQARDGKRPRHGAECDDEIAPAHRAAVDQRGASLEIEALRPPEQELGVGAHHAQRDDGVPRLERARGGLGQQRRVEHEVLRADDRRPAAAQEARDVRAREAAAEDEHVALF